MPAKPLVQSETTRAAVIAALMLGMLGLALAAAYAFTLKQRRPAELELASRAVGGLEFRAPADWRWRSQRGEAGGPVLGRAVFADPRANQHVLMVEALRWPAPVPPELVLAELLGPWLRQKGPVDLEDLAPEPIEVNGLKGLRVSEMAAGPHGPEHTLVVALTADQRRYWMVILRGAGGEDDQAVVADQRLLDAILDDARAASGAAAETRPGK